MRISSGKAHRLALMALAAVALAGCSGRKPDTGTPPPESSDDEGKRVENLSAALSRAQSRIEELDAKLASLTDKVDATRVTVENITGGPAKPIKTEAVGAARGQPEHGRAETPDTAAPLTDAAEARAARKSHDQARLRPRRENHAADTKHLLRMDSAISEFSKAMSLFRTGKYSDAELAFNHFTETYPEHILAGSAQFYAGESYFMMGEYKLAINEYGKVVSSFASSPRVASAMVRMAHCHEAVGASEEASHSLALAKDVFEGNPSLDWSGPSKGKTGPKTNLHAAPIEPSAADAKKPEEGEIDNLEEKAKH